MLSEAKAINLGTVLANVLEFEEQETSQNFSDFQRRVAEPIKLLYPEPENNKTYSRRGKDEAESEIDEPGIDIDTVILIGRARRKISWPKYLSEENARNLNKRLREIALYGEVTADYVQERLMVEDVGLEKTRLLMETFSEKDMAHSEWHNMAKKARAIAHEGIERITRDSIGYYYRKP